MSKSSVTRTMGPIHFEDLEPHRFEDLVRELLYDYKDWQSIEATGRSGGDGGFDVRAYEKNASVYQTNEEEADDSGDEFPEQHPMEGDLWMIQCKRESSMGPGKVKSIIQENIKPGSPPYGYILVAPADFSKKSFDVFREELKSLGVMEFYLWGKAALEDMLHLPKYDRILFTFFGISLLSRRRSRSTELRSRIGIKNKLYKVLGIDEPTAHTKVLIRDINDNEYPGVSDKGERNDKPKWLKCNFAGNQVHGIIIELGKHYGFFNELKKEWDIATGLDVNKLYEEGETEEEMQEKMSLNRRYRKFWSQLPRATQTHIAIWGLLTYDDIVLVDDKGDPLNRMAHIYTDFKYNQTPFNRLVYVTDDRKILKDEEFKRVNIFPGIIPEPVRGKIYYDQPIKIPDKDFKLTDNAQSVKAIFDVDGRYSFLKVGDNIQLTGLTNTSRTTWIEITHKESTTVKEYTNTNTRLNISYFMKSQLGDAIKDSDTINVYEYEIIYQPGQES